MRDVYFFLAHIDDFEISCIGFLCSNHTKYESVNIIIATDWEKKRGIWEDNLKALEKHLGIAISYKNLKYDQRVLMTNFDAVKDSFYRAINFERRFDIVTHDQEDCHTDHVACSMIANGIFKYANSYFTVYSPSSRNFKANYWVGMSQEEYALKKACVDRYNISNEQSYTKLGYYMQNEEHYNIGRSYHLENFVHEDHDFYETYRIIKMS